jgi:hypothetical protein
MRLFSVGGRSAATGAAIDDVAAQLWNPDSVRSLFVVELHWTRAGATNVPNLIIERSTARGATPGSTVTPDLNDDYEREITPDTGAVLELASFGTEPTLATPPMLRGRVGAVAGSGNQYLFRGRGLRIPPGTGLCVATETAVVIDATDFLYVFYE